MDQACMRTGCSVIFAENDPVFLVGCGHSFCKTCFQHTLDVGECTQCDKLLPLEPPENLRIFLHSSTSPSITLTPSQELLVHEKLGAEEAKLVALRSQAEDLTHQALTLDLEFRQNIRYLNYFNNNLRQLQTAKSRLGNALDDSNAGLQELQNERDRLHNLITLAQAENDSVLRALNVAETVSSLEIMHQGQASTTEPEDGRTIQF